MFQKTVLAFLDRPETPSRSQDGLRLQRHPQTPQDPQKCFQCRIFSDGFMEFLLFLLPIFHYHLRAFLNISLEPSPKGLLLDPCHGGMPEGPKIKAHRADCNQWLNVEYCKVINAGHCGCKCDAALML